MIRYRTYQNNNKKSDYYGKWYARTIVMETTETDKLADRIQRNCSMKRSDVLAVLAELVEVMTDELQLGNRVKLNGFGSFKVGMKTTPAETEEDFTVTKNVKSLHVLFQPEMHIAADGKRSKTFLEGARVAEVPSKKTKEEEEEETTVEP
jgi:predicted histone-like DNA-binding protein